MQRSRDNWLDTPIAQHVWRSRYRWTRPEGLVEENVEATWRRVARAVAAVEADAADTWESAFYHALEGFRFIPAGRILAGAGTASRVTLFNCFVMGLVRDDMAGIFEALKEGAVTMQAGGGVGYDFSGLRPRGALARSGARIASGPVSFLRVWDAMCATVLSTGARRGAMLASLRCDHPDIVEFIEAKRQPGALPHFNLSVQVTDALLDAVKHDQPWPLIFPAASLDGAEGRLVSRYWPGHEQPVDCRVVSELPARELWRHLTRNAYEGAEPGVLFVDTINRDNNLYWRENITTTNPCGEVPLPAYGACNLGSFDLTRFVLDAFTPSARLDFEALEHLVPTAVRLLDNVIDCSEFPLEQQAEQARGARRIGLGLTGVADALILLGHRYDDPGGREIVARAMRTITHAAYRASMALAREKGPFPFFESDRYRDGHFVRSLPPDIRNDITRHGIRNSHLTAIAPAGSISLLAGNVSSGIEPVFEARARRAILDQDGQRLEVELEDAAVRAWHCQAGSGDELPPAFATAAMLSPESHLEMMAAVQPFVDGAISKTIHVPESMDFESFAGLFGRAHELGLKGCTAYRPNTLRGSVLRPVVDGQDQALQANVHCCPFDRQGD